MSAFRQHLHMGAALLLACGLVNLVQAEDATEEIIQSSYSSSCDNDYPGCCDSCTDYCDCETLWGGRMGRLSERLQRWFRDGDDGCCGDGCCDPCCGCPFDFIPMMHGNSDFRGSLFGDLPAVGAPTGELSLTQYGGTVGRVKVSQSNSAIPIDRVFFSADYYDNVQLSPSDMDVEQMLFGIEKTFWDGQASIMVRVPFAATRAADFGDLETGPPPTIRVPDSDSEIGSIDITAKILLAETDNTSYSAGLLVGLPTNAHSKLLGSRVQNSDSVQITPFVAFLHERDRLFFQGFCSVAFDANGSHLRGGNGTTARVRAQQMLDLDLQAGYWSVRDELTGFGIAPFAEFHYTTPISTLDSILVPGGGTQATWDEYVAGGGIQFLRNTNVRGALAVNLPLSHELGRSADYQVGLRFEYTP